MQRGLTGQVAIVTGAGRGIGQSIAHALAEAGARVAVADINAAAAEKTANSIRAKDHSALELPTDVSSRPAVEQMARAVLNHWGQIDILVNNAGIADGMPILELTDEAWGRVIAVNLTSVFLCSQVVGRGMVRRAYGRIINVSSIAGQFGAPGQACYAATKAGILGLTRVMAVEWGPVGVTVNAVCPANIETELLREALAHRAAGRGVSTADVIANITANTPVGRLGAPGDVAALVVFLASPQAAFITGQVINICGGRTAHLS